MASFAPPAFERYGRRTAGSSRLVSAAQLGHGKRFFDASAEAYQAILPSLPAGRIVLNTVFMHGDVRVRPYRVEDFRDALVRFGMLSELFALGAYQMNHVWAMTFKDIDAIRKLLALTEVKVKDHRCSIVDPNEQGVRLKIHWLLCGVPDEDVRAALLPFGKVSEIRKERWRAQGVSD